MDWSRVSIYFTYFYYILYKKNTFKLHNLNRSNSNVKWGVAKGWIFLRGVVCKNKVCYQPNDFRKKQQVLSLYIVYQQFKYHKLLCKQWLSILKLIVHTLLKAVTCRKYYKDFSWDTTKQHILGFPPQISLPIWWGEDQMNVLNLTHFCLIFDN